METLSCTYPGFLDIVTGLVEDHKELLEEPIHLAIYYAPKERGANDVFLFEVLDDFEGNSIEEDGDMLEVTYGRTPDFPMLNQDSRLHIILASPTELRKAYKNKTNLFNELKLALDSDKAKVIFSDQHGEKLKSEVFQ